MRVALTGGAYQARSVIAGAQQCVNLIPEVVPQDEGEPNGNVHYPTPGLSTIVSRGTGAVRGLYRATNGQLYAVIDANVIVLDRYYNQTIIGTIPQGASMVSMADNGVDLVIVDGSAQGWHTTLGSTTMSPITDAAFYGGDRVDVLDGFFILNRPGTNQFYLSNNISTTFDPLYIVRKTGADGIVSLAVTQRQLWLFGEKSTEIWTDVGASDFPLQVQSGGIDHGCIAKYSVVRMNERMFWLSQDKDGACVVLMGAFYQAKRISTHAVEAAIQGYMRQPLLISDAIGWSYQQNGHCIYVLTFPTANKTWCYDLITGEWHEWRSADGNRHRGICHAFGFNGQNVVGDYASGTLYALSAEAHTEDGAAITRIRSFPHMVSDAKRVFYTCLIADMETGTAEPGQPDPQLTLRWSDDRGASWSQPVTTSFGPPGQALTSLQFQRLGMARDRVFELSWTAAIRTALQGAWITTKASSS